MKTTRLSINPFYKLLLPNKFRLVRKHNNNYIDLSSPTQDMWETEEIGDNLIQIENPYERPHRNINDTNVSNGETTLSGGPS